MITHTPIAPALPPLSRRLFVLSAFVCGVLLQDVGAILETRTAFEFTRAFETCDVDDMTLEATSRVIYSWNDADPDESAAAYHGPTQRGAESVNIVGSNPQFAIAETDVEELEIRVAPHTVDAGQYETLYYCELFALPADRPYHIVKYEMVINPDNFPNVHHALLYECPQAENHVGLADICPTQGVAWPDDTGACEGGNVVWGWAVGGGPMTLPEDIGYPIGEGGVRYVMLEMHYDLPGRVGITDDSGIVLHITPTLRPIEAGVLSAGLAVSPEFLQIPPGEEAYLAGGWCPGECLEESINNTANQSISLFSVFLHAHLAGRAIQVQHVRNGTELRPLRVDNNYDFNYQQYQWFDERELLPGDDIYVECTYNTVGREEVTVGGLATHQEMCLAYFMYYPRLPGSQCWSGSINETIGGPISVLSCNDEFSTFDPPVVNTTFVAAESCPLDEYPHPAYGNTTVSSLDSDSLDEWRASFEHSIDLGSNLGEGNYMMYWTTNAENRTVRIGVDAATAGWLGFGFSPNGGMAGSDVVMAWVADNGDLHFTDRTASANAEPSADTNQDYFNIAGVEYTVEVEEEITEAPNSTEAPTSTTVDVDDDDDDDESRASAISINISTTFTLAIIVWMH